MPWFRRKPKEKVLLDTPDLPFQLCVLFNSFPAIGDDFVRFVSKLEPKEKPFKLVPPFEPEPGKDGKRVGTTAIVRSDVSVAIIVHEWRMPLDSISHTITPSHWPKETKEALAAHDSYALLTCLGDASAIDNG
jgi:hypothetical protein